MSSTPPPPSPAVAIGIDLGTTNSCVGAFHNGKVEIIVNDHGHRVTPSMVAFTDTELLIGDAAKKQAVRNPENTVFDVNRLIGRRFDDPAVQEDMKRWPFEVVSDGNGKAVIQVKFKGEIKCFTPEEITSMLLGKMKETAEAFLGTTVTNAVIAVPTNFKDALKEQAIKDAASFAGLNVLRIIIKPASATFVFGLNSTKKNVLVFHLGGATLEVSLLKRGNGVYLFDEKSAVCSNLGGKDFDNRLVEHFAEEFKRQHQKDISTTKRALSRLRAACEQAKRVLSFTTQTFIEVDSLFKTVDFIAPFTRAEFEALCSDLFHSTLKPVKKALRNAELDKSQIDEVILLGGSTHMPEVQALLKEFFVGKVLRKQINPEETVAYSAAVQADVLIGNSSFFPFLLNEANLSGTTPLSLGINASGGAMKTVIERHTTFPVRKTMRLSTTWDYQTSALYKVYTGERAMASDNHCLGTLQLTDIPSNLCGKTQFDVSFKIDNYGILEVTAQVVGTGQKSCITILHDQWCLPKEKVERLVWEATMQYQLEDGLQRKRVSMFNALLEHAYQMKRTLAAENYLEVAEQRRAMEKVVNTLAWLQNNEQAKKKELEKKRAKLEAVCKPVIEKLALKK